MITLISLICGVKGMETKEILSSVYDSFAAEGLQPINQIVGYILSEDPTYITNYNNAWTLIRLLDRTNCSRSWSALI